MRTCPRCRQKTSSRFAVLPNESTMVCQSCFLKATGRHPIPAGTGLTLSGMHFGQYTDVPGCGSASQMQGPSKITLKGVTIKGATVRGVTLKGVTLRGPAVQRGTITIT